LQNEIKKMTFFGIMCCLLNNVVNMVETERPRRQYNTEQIGKGKAILVQAWTGPEFSRYLRLLDFKTIDT